jgi:hypothetical protein
MWTEIPPSQRLILANQHSRPTPSIAVVPDTGHSSIRIQHVTQAASSWPDASVGDRATRARLTETIERIRWRLWHGQVRRSVDLIGETMTSLDATAETASPAASVALKVARLE